MSRTRTAPGTRLFPILRLTLGLGLPIAAAACGTDSSSRDDVVAALAAVPDRFSGIVSMSTDHRMFAPCEGEATWWISSAEEGEELARAYSDLAGIPNDPVYAEVVGIVGPPPGTGPGRNADRELTVLEVRRTAYAREGSACPETPVGVIARGNEPFWHITVADGILSYMTPETPEPIAMAVESESTTGSVLRWSASLPGGQAIAVELAPERCMDSMSGERFPLTATLDLDGARHPGCGWDG